MWRNLAGVCLNPAKIYSKIMMGDVRYMKDLNMIVWITQLGLSVALPLAGFSYLGYLGMTKYGLGIWVLIVGFVLGIICAAEGLINSLKVMENQGKRRDKENRQGVSFNDHD